MSARRLSDEALVARVQEQTLRYFWEFADPATGLARDRSYPDDPRTRAKLAVGGTGFGIMAILVGIERGWIARDDAACRLARIVDFLGEAASFHGVWPHFLEAASGRTVPASRKDDGGDLVETAYLAMGLLCARQYLQRQTPHETAVRRAADRLFREIEWTWHTREGRDVLYWHWSPNNGWSMDFPIRGWNECLVTYVLAAGSPTFPVDPAVYHRGWAESVRFRNGRSFHGVELPLGPDLGGPLFFAHYSFLGLDPRGLVDRYADYGAQNAAHTRINLAHCIANPHGWVGYGPACWGLTASDSDAPSGYEAHAPDNDRGVISPTAAIASFPYAPAEAMRALRNFHDDLGSRIWTDLGFVDAFNLTSGWVARSHLAIDQGPIVVMLENYRSGLLWRLFMSCPEVRTGLVRLGFTAPSLDG